MEEPAETSDEMPVEVNEKEKLSKKEEKKKWKDPRTIVMPCPVLNGDTVTVTLLKDSLVRFRLTGPQSHDVLKAALQTKTVGHSEVYQNMNVLDFPMNSIFI